jgi:hypothetical protein
VKPVATVLVMAAIMVALCSAKGGEQKYVQGLMLDAQTYDWCHYDCFPFDRPTHYFCVQVDNRVLVGSHKADWKWRYDSSQMFRFRGKPVSVRYDDKSIWIVRTDGKEMHLTVDYSQDDFVNPECTAEIHRHWLKELEPIKRPDTVPADAVLIPNHPRRRPAPFFWITCKFDPQNLWDVCETWDEKGKPLTRLEAVDSATHRGVLQRDLAVDPLATKMYDEIHLQNGIVLRDWARGRINDKPISGSRPPLPPINFPDQNPND